MLLLRFDINLCDLDGKQVRCILQPHGLGERELVDILDAWEDPACSGPHLLPSEPALPVRGIADELAAALGRLG